MDSSRLTGIPQVALWMTLFVAVITRIAWLVVYRVYFHPLAKVPGPHLAKITFWYETWYEVVHDARFTWKCAQLHQKYGPIIRINPDELHINDPDYWDEVYSNSKRRVHKTSKGANSFGPIPGTFGTSDHDLHRIRRTPLNKHFSKKSIDELQPWIRSTVEKLSGRLLDAIHTERLVNLKYAYAAVNRDIIEEYCFSRTVDSVLLPDFSRKFTDSLEDGHHLTPLFIQFPLIGVALHGLPGWLAKLLSPGFGQLLDNLNQVSNQVQSMRVSGPGTQEHSQHPTVLQDLLESDLPPAEKSPSRIHAEAQTLIGAGTSTVAVVLTITTCHVVANPQVNRKLFEELRAAMLDPEVILPLQDLQQLPYLSAVILEGLRLSHSASHRLLRCFPDNSLKYGNTLIPAGTTVSMTPVLMHENSDIFSGPLVFRPERWLGSDARTLRRYLVPYGKGTRACLGINLANAELYLILATVFRRFDLELVDVTRERDYTVSRDTVIGSTSKESKGVQVRVKVA
ncbi:hypothetical protein MMC25_005772 [Agyrium rufum]|nr:hypothetical protein [Agyrium rufum]